MKPRVIALVSGAPDSALDVRAHSLFDRLADRIETRFVCHRGTPLGRVIHFLSALRDTRPALIYLMDPIYAAVAATQIYRVTRRVRLILDTGDLVYDLAKEMGRLGRIKLSIVKWAEQSALKMAMTVVVRGTFHRAWLIERGYSSVEVIPDGVDCAQFFPMDVPEWREQFGFSRDDIVIGMLGTINWNVRRKICYGWDLIEALALLDDLPVKGLLIGDGDGIAILKSRAQELGVADRVIFTRRVPYARLPRYINAMDIALLTQPVSPISNVRTTGKLPLYLACDRYILASRVGEASRVLEPEMLLPYDGIGRDENYPLRLAEKIRVLVHHRERLKLNGRGAALAREYFDYDRLKRNLAETIKRGLASN